MTTGISTSAIRRLTAALLALLVALPALAVIAQPASAHERTTQRCDYDPISGQSFNCRQVPVSHTHPKPKPEPTCPAGTTGTPPDCAPIPSDNTNHDGNQGDGSDESDDSDDSDSSDSGTEESSSEEETEEESGSDPQVPNHYSPPPDTTPRPSPPPTTAPPPPNHYSPPPDTSPRPDPEDDETESDGEAAESEEADDDCRSGTFVSGNCEPKPEGSPSGSDAEPAADDDETDEADEGGETSDDEGTNSDAGDDAAQDPCDAWADSTRDALFNLNSDGTPNITPAPEGCGTSTQDVIDALGDFFEKMGERRIENAEAKRQAYEALREAIRDAWNYEIPVLDEIHSHLDTALNVANCAGLGYVYVRSKGKVAKVPGFAQVVSALGCTTYIADLAIDDIDPGADDGDRDENGQSSGGDDATEQTVRPVQTPDTTTRTEPLDGDREGQQGDGDSGAANSETDPPSATESPVAVGQVTGLGGSADGNSVWLGWNAPASGPTPTAYRVLRTASGATEQEVARVGGNAYFDSNVQSGVTYTYRVQAISGTLAGPISASTSVTIP